VVIVVLLPTRYLNRVISECGAEPNAVEEDGWLLEITYPGRCRVNPCRQPY
jgi:hypothetical protein